jgi:hypothetical protein
MQADPNNDSLLNPNKEDEDYELPKDSPAPTGPIGDRNIDVEESGD